MTRRSTLATLVALVCLPAILATPHTTGDGIGPFPTWADGMAACQEEDGSTPGQPFPCRWESAEQGNGRGVSFTLTSGR